MAGKGDGKQARIVCLLQAGLLCKNMLHKITCHRFCSTFLPFSTMSMPRLSLAAAAALACALSACASITQSFLVRHATLQGVALKCHP
ncbi:hypothetical protein [Ottowia sp. oral taxon 894]|uniref:hypothetical protein n=1 Tax=Ottowia sp. oral taxon 894 TaxID=1658672 RepID=UPI0012E29A26|nr:hypothetical protein [Ottowia sp. oral taxon 894]